MAILLIQASLFTAIGVGIYSTSYDLRKIHGKIGVGAGSSGGEIVVIITYNYGTGLYLAVTSSVLYFVIGLLCIGRTLIIGAADLSRKTESEGVPGYFEEDGGDTLPTEIPAYLVDNRSRNPRLISWLFILFLT